MPLLSLGWRRSGGGGARQLVRVCWLWLVRVDLGRFGHAVGDEFDPDRDGCDAGWMWLAGAVDLGRFGHADGDESDPDRDCGGQGMAPAGRGDDWLTSAPYVAGQETVMVPDPRERLNV